MKMKKLGKMGNKLDWTLAGSVTYGLRSSVFIENFSFFVFFFLEFMRHTNAHTRIDTFRVLACVVWLPFFSCLSDSRNFVRFSSFIISFRVNKGQYLHSFFFSIRRWRRLRLTEWKKKRKKKKRFYVCTGHRAAREDISMLDSLLYYFPFTASQFVCAHDSGKSYGYYGWLLLTNERKGTKKTLFRSVSVWKATDVDAHAHAHMPIYGWKAKPRSRQITLCQSIEYNNNQIVEYRR